jgi:protein-S-isoprenylcysteine O-methyltransferase Ste14
LFIPRGAVFEPLAFPILLAGVGLLLWCVRDFYVAGRGTLAPWAPPVHLVTTGLYRTSRNPMYLAVLLILVALRSFGLAVYTTAVAVAFHLRVVKHEEPWLARTFGAEWADYRSRVPRWLGSRSS